MRDYAVAFVVMLTLVVVLLFVASPGGQGLRWLDAQRSASSSR